MSEPVYFGGLVKHRPESVPESGHHTGDDGREHYHCSVEGCQQEHPTAAHASAHAFEDAGRERPPAQKLHRDLDSGRFVEDASKGSVDAAVQHLDLTGAPDARTVAQNFARPLLVTGHQSDSPQNRSSSEARP